MTIDAAYRLVTGIVNKEQGGNVKPALFNELSIQCQLEAISVRLGNQKMLNGRFVPPIGYKSTQIAKEEILPLLLRPTTPLTIISNMASYPGDYFAYDHLQRADGTLFINLESDQMGVMRKSQITPPIEDDPFVCFHANGIEIQPGTISDALLYYVKRPVDPNWDYTINGQTYTYNSTSTPQQTGKVSQNFTLPEKVHKEICLRILKYLGIPLDMDRLTTIASQIESTTP